MASPRSPLIPNECTAHTRSGALAPCPSLSCREILVFQRRPEVSRIAQPAVTTSMEGVFETRTHSPLSDPNGKRRSGTECPVLKTEDGRQHVGERISPRFPILRSGKAEGPYIPLVPAASKPPAILPEASKCTVDTPFIHTEDESLPVLLCLMFPAREVQAFHDWKQRRGNRAQMG